MHLRQRIVELELFRRNRGRDTTVGLAPGAADQSPSFAVFAGFAQLRRGDAANTPARHIVELEAGAHQDVSDFHDLDRRVDAVDVSGGISFSDPETLRLGNRVVEALAD